MWPNKSLPIMLSCCKQCYVVDNSLKKIQEEKNQLRQVQNEQGRASHHLNPKGFASKSKHIQGEIPVELLQYPHCKRFHFGKCQSGELICFEYQKAGHMAKDCLMGGASGRLIYLGRQEGPR